jgi:hypothetical protein
MVPIPYVVFHQLDGLIADGVNDTEKLQTTVNNTLQTIKNLTSKAGRLSSGDISSSLDILDKIVDVTNITNGKIEKKVCEIMLILICIFKATRHVHNIFSNLFFQPPRHKEFSSNFKIL